MRLTSDNWILVLLAGLTFGCSGGRFDFGQNRQDGYNGYYFDRNELINDPLDPRPLAEEGFVRYSNVSLNYNLSGDDAELLLPDAAYWGSKSPVSIDFIRRPLAAVRGRHASCRFVGTATPKLAQDCSEGAECLELGENKYDHDVCRGAFLRDLTVVRTESRFIELKQNLADVPEAGAYNPSFMLLRKSVSYGGAWQPLPRDVNAPPALYDVQAHWTGEDVLVFGRTLERTALAGAFYSLSAKVWKALPTQSIVTTENFRALWVSGHFYVIASGGGAVFDPVTNSWQALDTANAPAFGSTDRMAVTHSATKIFVFAASDAGAPVGAALDTASGTWTSLSMTNAPKSDRYIEALWTDLGVFVWASGLSVYYPDRDEWKSPDFPSDYFPRKLGYSVDKPSVYDAHIYATQTGILVAPYAATASSKASVPTDGIAFHAQKREWTEVSLDAMPVRESLPTLSKDWLSGYGGNMIASRRGEADDTVVDSLRKYEDGGFIFDLAKNVRFQLPRSPSAPSLRGNAATLLIDGKFFVWGGCGLEYQSGGCMVPLSDGAVAVLNLP